MDWLADQGGGGAIDLVMHVQKVDFKQAVQWLSGQDLTVHPVHSQPQTRPTRDEHQPLQMPVMNEHRWADVRNYLIETRKLPAALIDRLHERGMIYADDYQNAVFVRYATSTHRNIWKRREPAGASLRGTWGEGNSFHGLAPGTSREQGWFWIGAGQGDIKRVLMTESPIDALSLATLDKHRNNTQGATIYLSTDGTGAMPVEALSQIMEQGGLVSVAFDADQAGEDMAWRVAQQLPRVNRVKPSYGKDWNERLIYDGHPERTSQPSQRDQETLRQLWQWHQVAQALGKSGSYLNRITEVARDVNRGVPLSEQAQRAMQQDFQQSQLLSESQQREAIFPPAHPPAETPMSKNSSSSYSIEAEID